MDSWLAGDLPRAPTLLSPLAPRPPLLVSIQSWAGPDAMPQNPSGPFSETMITATRGHVIKLCQWPYGAV